MKFLLVPSGNSLSHVAKCAVLEKALTQHGHRVLIAVSRVHADFLNRLSLPHTVLPDIQESDGGGLPTLNWFRSPDLLRRCIQAEIDLLKTYRPDRVVGVFRFTTKIACTALDVAYDSFACGCMMPDMREVLGFGHQTPTADEQALYLENFFRFAAKKMSMVMADFGMQPIHDLRDLLIGDRTFLWDYPEFVPLPERAGRFHVGPLSWQTWPYRGPAPEPFPVNCRPRALVCPGTQPANRMVIRKLVRSLLAGGYHVSVACGGHAYLMNAFPPHPRLRCWFFTPLTQLLPHAELVICHGGQMTLFESLIHQVPVLVMPSQPEQAHNGVCLERIRCGHRLVGAVAFKGDQAVYAHAFMNQNDRILMEQLQQETVFRQTALGLSIARQWLGHREDPERIAQRLEAI